MRTTITTTRKKIIDFILAFKKDKGYTPTVREIGSAINQKHPSVVQYHLDKLKNTGVIKRDGGARSVNVNQKIKFNIIENDYRSGSGGKRKIVRVPLAKELDMIEYFNGCAYCGKRHNGTYHKDHFYPFAMGGTDNKHNILLACPKCNLNKGVKEPVKWVIENFGQERLEKIVSYLQTR